MLIKKSELAKLVNVNLKKHVLQDEYTIAEINPLHFFSGNRFDLTAKYIYASALNLGIEEIFAEELYLAHIKAFNGFVENDESQKIGKEAFLSSFRNLYESIKNDGVSKNSIIPLSKNGVPLDGAHRIAVAAALGKNISTVTLDAESPNYNYEFFQHRGLETKYLDFIATQYAKLKDNIFVVMVWPSAEGKENELQQILKEYGDIIYRKEMRLQNEGPVHLVKQAYKNEAWVGSYKDGFIGAQNKARWCFEKNGPLRAYLLESNQDMIEMKEKIRKLFNIEKHAVHINDTKQETLELIGLLFNANSIHWMNHARVKNFSWFNTLFESYKLSLKESKNNPDNFCLIGSAGLASYGIREARDLDYIKFAEDDFLIDIADVDCCTNSLDFYGLNRSDIIFNPDNHMVIDGYKILSIENVRKYKNARASVSDISDVEKINKIMLGNHKKNLYPIFKKFISPRFYYIELRFRAKVLKKFICEIVK